MKAAPSARACEIAKVCQVAGNKRINTGPNDVQRNVSAPVTSRKGPCLTWRASFALEPINRRLPVDISVLEIATKLLATLQTVRNSRGDRAGQEKVLLLAGIRATTGEILVVEAAATPLFGRLPRKAER